MIFRGENEKTNIVYLGVQRYFADSFQCANRNFYRKEVCKAGIANVMGRDVRIMKSSNLSDIKV